MNPAFELDQIRRYIDYLASNPKQLGDTAESHFFPVLQRIFFQEGFEVRPHQTVNDRKFPFVLVDLDLRRPRIAVDFAYQIDGFTTMLPGFVMEWAESQKEDPPAQLLLLRNRPLDGPVVKVAEQYRGFLRFLDFEGLKDYASRAFEQAANRDQGRAVLIVIDLIEALIAAIAEQKARIEELEWFDVERLFHGILKGLGYHAHLTPPSHDGGRDVLACDIQTDDVHWYNIEIKHWRHGRKAGRAVAKSLLETSLREGRHGALLVSTSGVTDAALRVRTDVQEDYLRFADGDHVVTSCKHYTQTKSGIWTEHKTLRQFLFSGTV